MTDKIKRVKKTGTPRLISYEELIREWVTGRDTMKAMG